MIGDAAFPLDAAHVLLFHDACLESGTWPEEEAPAHPPGSLWPLIEENHACNARLWLQEDLARRRGVPDAEIVANKRSIDAFNQQRNDAMERCDELVFVLVGERMGSQARLHSETPGMMIDRLSILALKLRAMGLQAARADAGEPHRESCRAKRARIAAQRDDLAACLDALLADCEAGRARFKVYRQFKMYNDPAFNPALFS